MTAQEKAKCGLWLLKEAVLEFLPTNTGGVGTTDLHNALGLPSDKDSHDQQAGRFVQGLLNMLIREGKVTKQESKHFLANQTEAKA